MTWQLCSLFIKGKKEEKGREAESSDCFEFEALNTKLIGGVIIPASPVNGLKKLAGASLLAPAINYWWPSFPANLSEEGLSSQLPQDQWALRVARHLPWLTYWWNTQKFFPQVSILAGRPEILSSQDIEIIRSREGLPVDQQFPATINVGKPNAANLGSDLRDLINQKRYELKDRAAEKPT
ncbi:hypothetical protein SDJN02_06991, partial [Cucurbita argyrosperma subsp. argyrosperma]